MKSQFTCGDGTTFAFELVDGKLNVWLAAAKAAAEATLLVDEAEVLRDELDRYIRALRGEKTRSLNSVRRTEDQAGTTLTCSCGAQYSCIGSAKDWPERDPNAMAWVTAHRAHGRKS